MSKPIILDLNDPNDVFVALALLGAAEPERRGELSFLDFMEALMTGAALAEGAPATEHKPRVRVPARKSPQDMTQEALAAISGVRGRDLPDAPAKAPDPAGVLPSDAAARKATPIARCLLDYFPDALAMVAKVSYEGNKQHNGDAPPFWAYDKSTDEADCLMRHFADRGTVDSDGLLHTAKVAWRALAMLQREMILAGMATLPRGARLTSLTPIPNEPADVTKVRDAASAAIADAALKDMKAAAEASSRRSDVEAAARVARDVSNGVSRHRYPHRDAKDNPLYPDTRARVVATAQALKEIGVSRKLADALVTVQEALVADDPRYGKVAGVRDAGGTGWAIPHRWLVRE